MPLKRGSSRAIISENIRRERRAGRSEKQAVAIAYAEARKTAKPIATAHGKGWRVTLSKVGSIYEVWKGSKRVHWTGDARIARQQFAELVQRCCK